MADATLPKVDETSDDDEPASGSGSKLLRKGKLDVSPLRKEKSTAGIIAQHGRNNSLTIGPTTGRKASTSGQKTPRKEKKDSAEPNESTKEKDEEPSVTPPVVDNK